MNYLQRYAESITVGLHGELKQVHEKWKKQRTTGDPRLKRVFKTLERPSSWNALFRAMNNTGFTQSDVYTHYSELREEGEHDLAGAVQSAAEDSPSFKLMEMG